jgi:acyl CoA:acetate/3-ketoacid CoA transferase beta subunit
MYLAWGTKKLIAILTHADSDNISKMGLECMLLFTTRNASSLLIISLAVYTFQAA